MFRIERTAGVAWLAWIATASAALLAGCGSEKPDLGQVHGTVTLDGDALVNAKVRFTPQGPQGRTSWAVTDAAGHYELSYTRDEKGAAVGTHRVEITTVREGPDDPEIIPPKYNANSELTEEVTAGENEIDFKLTSD